MRIVLLVLGLGLAGPLSAELVNRVAGHPSPYLALHGEDPVHWQALDEGALAYARGQGRLILVSSGYFACHWCHVMQRESFRDPEVAGLLNEHFVPVKLDRELSPAVDAHLAAFVERTRGAAGWPLNVFLTPEGYPLFGLTYMPREQFAEVLRGLRDRWDAQRAELALLARLAARVPRPGAKRPESLPPPDPGVLRALLLEQALQVADELQGGFGDQARFPMAPQLLFLMDVPRAPHEERIEAFLALTLEQMARRGLRDHLAGGFFRYTTDPDWRTPHYEKMLYTQALLARVYLRGARLLERPDFLDLARETLDFALDAMRGAEGGFVASLSAVDAQGEEGGSYLWTDEELERLLNPDRLALARARWGMDGVADADGGHLPLPAADPEAIAAERGVREEAVRAELEAIRGILLRARARRAPPRDPKRLAGWNGLMLSALTEGARELGDPRYRAAAGALRDFLVRRLWDGELLSRAWRDGRTLGPGALDDYAYVAAGLRDWAALTGSAEDRALAASLVERAWERFHGPDGWRSAARPPLPAMPAAPVLADGPMPSETAVVLGLSLDLGGSELRAEARRALRLALPSVREAPLLHASHVRLLLERDDQPR